jgi:hypothetical protein
MIISLYYKYLFIEAPQIRYSVKRNELIKNYNGVAFYYYRMEKKFSKNKL